MNEQILIAIPSWLLLPTMILGYIWILLSIATLYWRRKSKLLDLEIAKVSERVITKIESTQAKQAKKSKAGQTTK